MIFYFSGTGNTKWVAQQLAEATGETLCYIPDELKAGVLSYQLKSGERLGFCFPTHGWQPPRIVRDFIRRSAFTWDGSQMPYVFAVTTCGDNMGHAMRILNKELSIKRLQDHS
jgi:flavodoxin